MQDFLGGGALVPCCTSIPINHIVFFVQNTSFIRKLQVISGGGGGGGGAHPKHPPPRSANVKMTEERQKQSLMTGYLDRRLSDPLPLVLIK